ncbi:hypothetical protein [Streptomyces sp. A0592]|uniref:hypothetical protein n=1 Tax=Streptomyces sp. A0592 TaxID=2563099 RepID=UPI00109EA141|nr:hypothetical protein [Streptomyces sp. A0592]THA81242.1 hypothetical protein E6U81_25760 [Streptomyces sp. A0592]
MTTDKQFKKDTRDLDLVVTAGERHRTDEGAHPRRQPGPADDPDGVQRRGVGRLVIREAAGLVPGRHVAPAEVEFSRRN